MAAAMKKKKKVVVVGAGPSGLVALKEMLEAGHDAVAIEKSHVIGGVFSTLADSCYDSLYLTISNVFMAYSDFPCEEDYIKYSKKEEYARYLERYAEHFELNEKIRFETTVDKAAFNDQEGTWTIRVSSKKDGVSSTDVMTADSLVVCTGSNQTPKKTPENIAKFSGQILHSSDFQNHSTFEDKRVMIVGVGESATDIASEISTVAQSTTVWSRRPFIVAARYALVAMTTPGFDEFACMQDEAQWRKLNVADFLELLTTSRANSALPTWLYAMLRHVFWRSLFNDTKNPAMQMLGKTCEYACNYPGVDSKTYFRADQAGWVTKNSRLMQMLADKALEVIVSPQATFSDQTCTFQNVVVHNDTTYQLSRDTHELTRDFDVVVCCTGYTNDFPWLDPGSGKNLDWCPRTWYKHCWPPGFKKGELAFVGWARPHQGGIPQTSELCSRFHALLLQEDRHVLPDNIEELIRAEAKAETEFYNLSPHLTSLVDWPSFAHALARMVGCEPKTPSLVFAPVSWLKYWIYPLWPCWFRLVGPGAKPDTYHTVMDRFPLLKSNVFLDPVLSVVVLPGSILQKFLVNLLAFPLTWGRAGSDKLFDLFGKSKVNVLHGTRLRLRDLFTWSM